MTCSIEHLFKILSPPLWRGCTSVLGAEVYPEVPRNRRKAVPKGNAPVPHQNKILRRSRLIYYLLFCFFNEPGLVITPSPERRANSLEEMFRTYHYQYSGKGRHNGTDVQPKESHHRRRLKTRGYIIQYSTTLKKSVIRTNSHVES